jgi:cytochrome c oxidase subunit III
LTEIGRVIDARELPREVPGRRASVYSGMLLFIIIEGTVIASLLTSYYYLRVMTRESWPPPGVSPPELSRPAISLALLVASLGPMIWARVLRKKRQVVPFHAAVLFGITLLVAYLGVSFFDLHALPYDWRFHVYGSLVWTLTGYQILHVIGLTLLALGVLFLARPAEALPRDAAVSVLLLYWSFVVIVALPSYFTLYLTPHLF